MLRYKCVKIIERKKTIYIENKSKFGYWRRSISWCTSDMPRTFGFNLESKSRVKLFYHLCSLEIYQILNLRSPVPSIENSFIRCASSCLCVFYEWTKKKHKQLSVVILTIKTKAVLRQLLIYDLKLSSVSDR